MKERGDMVTMELFPRPGPPPRAAAQVPAPPVVEEPEPDRFAAPGPRRPRTFKEIALAEFDRAGRTGLNAAELAARARLSIGEARVMISGLLASGDVYRAPGPAESRLVRDGQEVYRV